MKKSDLVAAALAIFFLSKKAELEQDANKKAHHLDELVPPKTAEEMDSEKNTSESDLDSLEPEEKR